MEEVWVLPAEDGEVVLVPQTQLQLVLGQQGPDLENRVSPPNTVVSHSTLSGSVYSVSILLPRRHSRLYSTTPVL